MVTIVQVPEKEEMMNQLLEEEEKLMTTDLEEPKVIVD